MSSTTSQFHVRLAETPADVLAAQKLRYRVFVAELGGHGPGIDHDAMTEADRFDQNCEHLLLIDRAKSTPDQTHVVGVYRMMMREHAQNAGGFYSASEYDLEPLLMSGRPVLELGRSCVDPAYRGGTSMYLLWNALAKLVLDRGVEVLFGVASFHGTDPNEIAAPLSFLHHNHLAPPELRVRAYGAGRQPMDLIPAEQIDRVAAMRDTPALIKAYLRLGGCVGEGAFIDHAFNTIDVCLVMDTALMNAKSREIFTRKAAK
jgi:putative hemolysin